MKIINRKSTIKFPFASPFHPIPSDRLILETANCLAFYDAYPVSRGHTLVVPLQTVQSIFELDESLQTELWETVRRVREILSAKFSPDGFNVGVNDGRAAGQTIPHAHIHVIPRYDGDVADPRGGIRWIIPEKARYWAVSPSTIKNQKSKIRNLDNSPRSWHNLALKKDG